MIGERLPVTLSLVTISLVVIFMVGVALGVFSATRRGAAGRAVDAIVLGGYAIPSFWAGAILISLFAVRFEWFPATGYVPLTQSVSEWAHALVLPIIALSLQGIAGVAKQTREAMLDVLASEHVRVARENGIPERSIVLRHALKIASVRSITILGIYAIAITGGTVFVETVFAIPGLGGLTVEAASRNDLPVVQGALVIFTVVTVCLNLVTDLAYTWLNPRVRAE
jgi:peptide/nickel transport system permease protein